ncbi:MAG: zinc ribbon domain-containing protein [Gemmatimonadetes bacterium]|nr:zinc ribbon domain-containing protein [Gemmatimonadota bacterium]
MVNDSVSLEDELVSRVHACLADAMRRTRLDPFGTPVTVAEIYQDLVPYRRIRSAVGFQMNADYEHTLLRLLSGEGGYARLEPSEARDELRAELESPNPNVGLFRKYAACDVWITPAELPPVPDVPAVAGLDPVSDDVARPMSPADHGNEEAHRRAADAVAPDSLAPVPPPPVSGRDASWGGMPAGEWDAEPELLLEDEVDSAEPEIEPAAAAMPTPPAGASKMIEPKSHAPGVAGAASPCSFCNSALPDGRLIRFCPFCGTDQALRPCGECGEALQTEWRFCIACGAAQS